jgi:SAM-dependent methyltransferase
VAQRLIHDFIAELDRKIHFEEPIVEFGSLQVEPEQDGDLRPLFADREFVGTDLRTGPGVDRVEDLRGLKFEEGSVGTALCLDTLEHCADPLTACREMHRVLRPGGVCVISSVMLFGIHGYPNDFWRFTPEGMKLLLEPFEHAWSTGVGEPDIPMQVIGVGARDRPLELSREDFPSLVAAQSKWEAPDRIRIGPLRMTLRETLRDLGGQIPRVIRARIRD